MINHDTKTGRFIPGNIPTNPRDPKTGRYLPGRLVVLFPTSDISNIEVEIDQL